MFIEIADEIHEQDELTRLDTGLADWLHLNAQLGLTRVIRVLTWLGSPAVVLPVAALVGALWWKHKRFARAALIWAGVFGGLLLNTALKYAFSRARPAWDEPLGAAHGFSFPSGHVAGATLLYGSVALLLFRDHISWRTRAAVLAILGLLIAIVSFTRLYLGVHYLSDVLAAQAIAWAWLALCVTALDTLRRRRAWLQEKSS